MLHGLSRPPEPPHILTSDHQHILYPRHAPQKPLVRGILKILETRGSPGEAAKLGTHEGASARQALFLQRARVRDAQERAAREGGDLWSARPHGRPPQSGARGGVDCPCGAPRPSVAAGRQPERRARQWVSRWAAGPQAGFGTRRRPRARGFHGRPQALPVVAGRRRQPALEPRRRDPVLPRRPHSTPASPQAASRSPEEERPAPLNPRVAG